MNHILPQYDIQLFYADGEKYFYHTPSGLIFRIANEHLDRYIDICLGKQPADGVERLCEHVHGIIKKTVAEYGQPDEMPSDEPLPFKPSCVVLNVAGKCNLVCPYCFARGSKGFAFKSMSTAECMASIEFMLKNNPDEQSYSVTFFGGEPFLEFDTMREVVTLVKQQSSNKKISFSATTNGTIMTEAMAEFIKQHNIALLISIDGPQTITNALRPHQAGRDTYADIMRSLEILRRYEISVELRATIAAGSVDLAETARFFERMATPYHFVFCFDSQHSTNEHSNWDAMALESLSVQLDSLFDFYFDLLQSKTYIYGHWFLEHLHSISGRRLTRITCGSGVNMFSTTDGGRIFGCMNFASNPETSIGSVEYGVDEALRLRYAARPTCHTRRCDSCTARYYCGGGCLHERYTSTKSVEMPNEHQCSLRQLIFQKMLSYYQQIKNRLPEAMERISEHKQHLLQEC